jgi:hypothetical protein
LDAEVDNSDSSQPRQDDAGKDLQPGSWVILEKSGTVLANEAGKLDVPAFDRIYVLGYDKDRQEHYTVYRSPDLEGYLPLRVEQEGDSKIFSVRLQHDGQLQDARYRVRTDDRGLLKVEPLNEPAKSGKKR